MPFLKNHHLTEHPAGHLEPQTPLCGSVYNSNMQSVAHWSTCFPTSSAQPEEPWRVGPRPWARGNVGC